MNEDEVAAGLAPTPNYRYCDQLDDRLYVAGQVPLDGSGKIVGVGDPSGQARQCLANLAIVVRTNGFAMTDVRRLVIYVVGPREHLRAAWRGVCAAFDDDVPPSTLLGVNLLGYDDQLVEIDADVERE